MEMIKGCCTFEVSASYVRPYSWAPVTASTRLFSGTTYLMKCEEPMSQQDDRDIYKTGLGSAGPAKCLIAACGQPAAAVCKTGLCLPHHSKAKKAVEAGTTTWAELVELGLALATDGDDLFTKALNDARRGKDAATGAG